MSKKKKKPKYALKLVHHYSEDLACPACGTDSTVGCIAAPPKR